MAKKSAGENNHSPSETPETEWPMRGGRYIRNLDTGVLAEVTDQDTADDTPVDTNEQPED